MLTYKIENTIVLEKLQYALYKLKVIEDLYNSSKEDINPLSSKWEIYVSNLKQEAKTQYEAILNKVIYEYAPYENFTYNIDFDNGVINYCES